MKVELHDDGSDGKGTLFGRLAVEYEYQLEQWLIDLVLDEPSVVSVVHADSGRCWVRGAGAFVPARLVATHRLHNRDGDVIASVTQDACYGTRFTHRHCGAKAVAVFRSIVFHAHGCPPPNPLEMEAFESPHTMVDGKEYWFDSARFDFVNPPREPGAGG